MNLNFRNIIVCSFLLGLFACTDEEAQTNGNKEQEVRVFGSVMSNSRVSFEQDGNVTHASWNNGDQIGLYAGKQVNLNYEVSENGTGKVEFKPNGDVLKSVDGSTVVAYYPYSSSVENMIVPLPVTSNFVWSEMKPFVYASNTVENGSVSLNFKHPFAYLKIAFSKDDLPEWAEKQVLNTIEIIAVGKDLGITEGYFNLSNFQQTMTSATSTITVDAANFDLASSDFCCYVPVLPQVAAQPLTFRFIQNNGSVEDVLFQCKKNASTEGVKAGYVYDVALNDDDLPLSPDKLKERIDGIGREFVSNFKVSEFAEIKNTARYILETFCEKEEATDAVTTWYDACLDAITETLSSRDTTETNTYSGYNYIDISETYYHYKDLSRVYAASQFVGHFTVKDKIWVREDGDFSDLQFTAPDESGNLCTLKLTTSGETKKVYIGDYEDEDWYNWTEEVKDSIMYEYYPTGKTDSITGIEIMDTVEVTRKIYKYTEDVDMNSYMNYVVIPEIINIEYTQGSTQILNTVITTNHSALQPDRFDIATEDLSVVVETYVNGFEFIMSRMVYDAGNNVEVACKLNKNGTNLITLSANSDLGVSGDVYEKDIVVDKCENMVLNIDLIHQMQLKFTCEDGVKVDELMDLAEANKTDEVVYGEKLDEINALMSGGLYLDGKPTQQAWVTLEPFQEEDWDGSTYWTWEPVLNFTDDSSYSPFSTYFNEDDFRSLINMAWDVVDDFANWAQQIGRNW